MTRENKNNKVCLSVPIQIKKKTSGIRKKKTSEAEKQRIKKREQFLPFVGKKTLLVFDVASEKTGWSYWIEGRYVASGVLTAVGKNAAQRYPQLAKEIIEMVEHCHPESVVVESAFLKTNFNTTIYPVKLQGLTEYAASCKKAVFTDIAPVEWRTALKFPSDLKKEKGEVIHYKTLSIERARELTGKNITDDNEADAVCIGAALYLLVKRHTEQI